MTDKARAGEPRTEAGRVRRELEHEMPGMPTSDYAVLPMVTLMRVLRVLGEVEAAAAPSLDVPRLAEAARAAGRKMNVPLLANPVTWRDFADEIAAEYARLSEGGPEL